MKIQLDKKCFCARMSTGFNGESSVLFYDMVLYGEFVQRITRTPGLYIPIYKSKIHYAPTMLFDAEVFNGLLP